MPTGDGLSFEKVWAMFQETDKRFLEIELLQKENVIQMKETDKRIGELTGYHFNGVAPGGYEIRDNAGKAIAEVDILLENDARIMGVEVKAKVGRVALVLLGATAGRMLLHGLLLTL